MNIDKRLIKNLFLALLSAIVGAINLNSFVHCGNITPGGFSGMALLLTRVFDKYFNMELSYSILYLIFNLPAVILVIKYVGKQFTLVSLVGIVLISIFVEIFPYFQITEDILLNAVAGGVLSGVSSALVLMADGCAGGMDFISIYFAKRFKKSFWNESLLVNATLLMIAGLLFGWEASLYSIVFQFAGTQVVKAADNRFKRNAFIIITDKEDEICQDIQTKLNHSATILDGLGYASQKNKKVIYTVCGNYETNMLLDIIQQHDPSAFVNITHSERVVGYFNEKPFY
ncbi:MAG TPA: YitT family protein [Erysipelotrichaceae bacterium]|nr:YitT family protein [Erysipelotrichaceae bacterium]HQA84613.1 YitT family protein [Erysipelotrichaceae bacterium]